MKSISTLIVIIVSVACAMAFPHPAIAQCGQENVSVEFARLNLSGPRFGLTAIPGNTEIAKRVEEEGFGRVISQFGWHFERVVVPVQDAPSFAVQLIPLIGGVEYGKFIPGATLAMGIRFRRGFEFGMGPNVVFGREEPSTSLVVAAGQNINYSGISVPINFAVATSPSGQRYTLLVGYAIRR